MNGLLALALTAGMLAPVNPCGFALLPAWITHTLGDQRHATLSIRLARAARSGGFATPDDQILVVAGVPFNTSGTTNILRVAPCEERLIFATDPG